MFADRRRKLFAMKDAGKWWEEIWRREEAINPGVTQAIQDVLEEEQRASKFAGHAVPFPVPKESLAAQFGQTFPKHLLVSDQSGRLEAVPILDKNLAHDNPLINLELLYLQIRMDPPPIPMQSPNSRSKDWSQLIAWHDRHPKVQMSEIEALTGIPLTTLSWNLSSKGKREKET